MIKTITQSNFLDEFNKYPNHTNNFTYEGKIALFEYFEYLEESINEQIELDIIVICCDYTEYETPIECAENYFGFSYSDIENISFDDAEKEALEFLESNTTVIKVGDTGRVIVQNF